MFMDEKKSIFICAYLYWLISVHFLINIWGKKYTWLIHKSYDNYLTEIP